MSDSRYNGIQTRGGAEDLRLRAAPESWNPETREIEVVWSTGADVQRSTWMGERWIERLSMDPAHIRTERLEAGAPLLDSHRSYGAANVLGSVVPGSVRVEDGVGFARVRLTDAADVASTVRKIVDGSIRNISVGYRIHRNEVSEAEDGSEIRTATDWEPHEISAVPVPADARAQVRELPGDDALPENDTMTDKTPAAPVVDVAAERAAAIADERKRVSEINAAARSLGIDDAANAFIDDGTSADVARAALIEKRAEQDKQTKVKPRFEVGRSHDDKIREGITNAVMHRTGLTKELTAAGRSFRGLSLVEMAREEMVAKGIEGARSMPARQVAKRAFAPQPGISLERDFDGNIRAIGGHTTSDFPYLLANVGNKFLQPGYASEVLNFMPFVRDRSLPDFKQASVVNLGRINSMSQKAEGTEYNRVTIGEEREQYALATYGSTIGFSREAMINDDLGGFELAIREMGAVWARTQKDLFWAVINDNAAMADGTDLFHADHDNLGSAAAISKTTLAALRQLLMEQKGVESSSGAADGQFLNLMPAHLIVPPDLWQTAEDLMGTNYDPTTLAAARPGWVGGLTLTVEPRLGVSSATAYYLAAERPFCERGLLGGSDAPYIDSMDEWSTDEMVFKVRGDVAFKATDWRPITKNAGA